jgi:hypothetical protein
MRVLALASLVLALTLAGASPALADPISGGCTVDAQSDVDATNVTDATRTNPFDVDPAGNLTWIANSPGPIKNHTWSITIDIGGVPVPVAQGGDPNDAGTTTSTGDESIPELIEGLPDAVQPLLTQLTGIYQVSGDINGEGGSCSGSGWVRVTGFRGIGLGAAAFAIVGALLMISGGRPR